MKFEILKGFIFWGIVLFQVHPSSFCTLIPNLGMSLDFDSVWASSPHRSIGFYVRDACARWSVITHLHPFRDLEFLVDWFQAFAGILSRSSEQQNIFFSCSKFDSQKETIAWIPNLDTFASTYFSSPFWKLETTVCVIHPRYPEQTFMCITVCPRQLIRNSDRSSDVA